MKKNLIVTCVLCLAMFLVGINPCFVSANEMTDQENSDEYVAVLLSDTSEDFQNEIKKCKINTNELTLVNVIKEKAGNTAFQVLTVNGDQVERSIISYLDANARQQLVSKKDILNNGAKNSSSGSLFVFGNYARIVITGSYTAVTPSWITAVLHQPYRVAFYYVPSVVLSMTDVTA